jgi:hypothetical protein
MNIKSETLPIYGTESHSETFQESFSGAGTYSAVDCICGRTHFCSDMYCDDEEQESDLKRLIESEKTNPDAFISYSREDGISYFNCGNKSIVFSCKCNYAGYLENLFLNHQPSILSYFNRVSEEKLKSAEKFRNDVLDTSNKASRVT